ncbi:MAG: hypothetical protein JRN59_07275 [Nitrososphaerota archaeon]|nr:hypothetical protein [Nitrososphaerota archaeon]
MTIRGLCVVSQVQTAQETKQVTTYQQEQAQEPGQRLVGYSVYETTDSLVGYTVTEATWSSVQSGYDVTAHYPVTTQVLSGYDLYVTVARATYTCPSGWSNAGNGLCSYSCSYTTTYTTTETVMHGYEVCVPIDVRTGACVWKCIWPFCWTSTVNVVKVVVHYVTVYTDATAATTYTQEYDGFSSSCPSYAYQIGMACDPVYTAQTTYQSESLGQLSYCPAPDRYTRTYYSCSPVYHQQTTTTSLGQLTYCPAGSSATQYSCSPVYQSRTTTLGQMSYCPSGSQYSCSAVCSAYNYWVTETVPVVTTVSYETVSTLGSAWLIGG